MSSSPTFAQWPPGSQAVAASAPPRDRTLTRSEKPWLALLALPTVGLVLAITVVSTCVPVLARRYVSSALIIGLIVGVEGLAATFAPVAVGTWSERLRTRFGRRLPFVLAGTPRCARGRRFRTRS